MEERSIWRVLDAYERLVDAYLCAGEEARSGRRHQPVPAAAMLSLESCADVLDGEHMAVPVRGLAPLQILEDFVLD